MNRICSATDGGAQDTYVKPYNRYPQMSQGGGLSVKNNEIVVGNANANRDIQSDVTIPTVSEKSRAIYEKYCKLKDTIMTNYECDPLILKYVNMFS